MVDLARWSSPMDRSSLNTSLTARAWAWCFRSPSKMATKLINPDFPKPCITCCRRITRTCWESREQEESRRQDPSNFVAVLAPRPFKLRRCDSSGSVAPAQEPLRRLPPARPQQGSSRSCGPHNGNPAEVAVSAPRPLKLRRSDP